MDELIIKKKYVKTVLKDNGDEIALPIGQATSKEEIERPTDGFNIKSAYVSIDDGEPIEVKKIIELIMYFEDTIKD